MSDPLARCTWPPLPTPYGIALRQAVEFVLARFDPEGILATGTIVRGTPHASSDLDVCVIHSAPFRQRIQERFGGVPAEIFVNPPTAIRRYFVEEHADGQPITAHMFATGAVVLARSPVVEALRAEAAAWLARESYPTESQLLRARYDGASRLEDALDVADSDPATSMMLLGQAVTSMLRLHCRVLSGTIVRGKDLLRRVEELDPAVGALARRFFSDAPLDGRRAAAEEIADLTIGTRGFFAWDSGPEAVKPD